MYAIDFFYSVNVAYVTIQVATPASLQCSTQLTLTLNVSKTKELIIDLRKKMKQRHNPLNMN